MKIDFIPEPKSKYILACSFGPDSMALFDLLLKAKIDFVVCHVNYHKRDISNFEEASLKEYCAKHNILCEVLDTSNLIQKGNFQAWAREIRYAFFKDCYLKYDAKGLFIAHHQDDLIETFIMQKRRHGYVGYYGIAPQTTILGMNVIRPLLNYTKKELKDYDDIEGIPYSIDVSNFTDHYERNRIRHSIIEKMTIDQRRDYLKQIGDENLRLNLCKNKVAAFLTDDSLDIEQAKLLSNEEFAFAVFSLLGHFTERISLSSFEIAELKALTLSSKPNINVSLGKGIYYCQEYSTIRIVKLNNSYNYTIQEPSSFTCPQFVLDFSVGAEDRNIFPSSYPITIRNASSKDTYSINDYEVSLRRLFIDWKMPKHLRKSWPVVLNKEGKIIYIPRYRKTFADTHKSKFLISLK